MTRKDFVVASLGAKFQERIQKDPYVARKQCSRDVLVDDIARGDPSPNQKHLQWLIKAYTNGSRVEDLVSRGRNSLTKFEVLKRKNLLPSGRADIGKLRDLKALEDLVDSIHIPEEALVDRGKYEEWLNNDEVRVIIVLDETAARYYGQGTKWCTAAKENNAFLGYCYEGHLIVLLPKHPEHDGEKYQIHFQEGQIMDEKDTEVDWLEKRFPSISLKSLERSTRRLFQKKLIDEVGAGTSTVGDLFSYICNNKGDAWPEAEALIMKNPMWAYEYASQIRGRRWKNAEPYIMKDPKWALEYAINVIGGRWPEAEPYIKKDPQYAYHYASNVIGGRWPEAEPYIKKDSSYMMAYTNRVYPGERRHFGEMDWESKMRNFVNRASNESLTKV